MLSKSFGINSLIPLTALQILFDYNLFNECIKEIKDRMGIPCTLRVRYHADHIFPEKGASAFITNYEHTPYYGSQAFKNLVFEVHFRESLKKDFYKFLYAVTHELSHIVLNSTHHRLKESEVATDLFVMTCGFEHIMEKGRISMGYLDNEHFLYAQKYLQRLRLGKQGMTFTEKIETIFQRFHKAP